MENWFKINTTEELPSPALLFYPERIKENIASMIKIAGHVSRLRPHVKTYKNANIIKMQLEAGINKFKCATIAEAQLCAKAGAKDVLLAIQPVGYTLKRFLNLRDDFPEANFSCIVDSIEIARQLAPNKVPVFVDLNVGMNRTGVSPNKEALALIDYIDSSDLIFMGLHVYDGHIRDRNFNERKTNCDLAFANVTSLVNKLSVKVPTIIAGGSPTFPVHALRKNVELSPGTTLLWDQGYKNQMPELPFLPAAVLFTRVISKPSNKLVCLDLGHKAVAPEMPFPRIAFLSNGMGKQISQSEEHLVVEKKREVKLGEGLYALPMHVCPTVAKYPQAYIVENNEVVDVWEITARDH